MSIYYSKRNVVVNNKDILLARQPEQKVPTVEETMGTT